MQTGRKLESGWGGIPERDSQIFSEILSELSYQGLATVKTFIQMFSEIFLNFQKITKLINKAGAYFIPFLRQNLARQNAIKFFQKYYQNLGLNILLKYFQFVMNKDLLKYFQKFS